MSDLPELARRAIEALRLPDQSLARCPNTVRQSIADVIERLMDYCRDYDDHRALVDENLPLAQVNIPIAEKCILRVFEGASSQLDYSMARDALAKLVEQASIARTAQDKVWELGREIEDRDHETPARADTRREGGKPSPSISGE